MQSVCDMLLQPIKHFLFFPFHFPCCWGAHASKWCRSMAHFQLLANSSLFFRSLTTESVRFVIWQRLPTAAALCVSSCEKKSSCTCRPHCRKQKTLIANLKTWWKQRRLFSLGHFALYALNLCWLSMPVLISQLFKVQLSKYWNGAVTTTKYFAFNLKLG